MRSALTHMILVVITMAMGDPAARAQSVADSKIDLWGGKRTFEAALSADNQPTVTDSDGVGSAKIVLDIARSQITWDILHSHLSSPPTAIGLHGPAQPGTNGALLIDLRGKGLTSPIHGNAKVSAGQIQYMLLGWTYVLISTNRYPNGEIRGKLDVMPPAAPVRSH